MIFCVMHFVMKALRKVSGLYHQKYDPSISEANSHHSQRGGCLKSIIGQLITQFVIEFWHFHSRDRALYFPQVQSIILNIYSAYTSSFLQSLSEWLTRETSLLVRIFIEMDDRTEKPWLSISRSTKWAQLLVCARHSNKITELSVIFECYFINRHRLFSSQYSFSGPGSSPLLHLLVDCVWKTLSSDLEKLEKAHNGLNPW